MLASYLSAGHEFGSDNFWPDSATALMSGLIAHIATAEEKGKRTLNRVRSYIYDDLDYKLAVILDNKEHKSDFVADEFKGYLNNPSSPTRPCVLSSATTYVKALGSQQVAKTLETSTINLADVVAGRPLTIYVVIPPEKLKSHRALLRIWVGTLLIAVMRRRVIPDLRTLFVIDEAAQLGTFEPLLVAATLLRGYGMQLVTIWQDLSQMKSRYPNDWQTILNNSAVIQAFGFAHHGAAKDWGDLMGMDAKSLLGLGSDEAVLSVRGEGAKTVRRLNYLKDSLFKGLADENPYYARKGPGVNGRMG
jgi:type IV secretion system protein VirD4